MSAEDTLQRLQELIGVYEEVTQTYIPKTLDEAIKQKWELSVNGIEVGVIAHYPQNEQEEDSHRIITLRRALAKISEMENLLVRHNTKGEARIIWDQFASAFYFCQYVLTAAYDLGVAVGVALGIDWITSDNWIDFLLETPTVFLNWREAMSLASLAAGELIFSGLLGAASVEALTRNCVTTIGYRNDCVEKMRASALPHRNGRRFAGNRTSRR